MTSKTPELLPCPFCGASGDRLVEVGGGDSGKASWIECRNCNAFGPDTSHHWNTRTPTNHDDYDEAAKEVGLL